MNNHEHRQHLLLILCTACIYFIADLPVQLTAFLQYGPFIGIKNFLPTTFGLLFGPYGVMGALIGCTATAVILHTPFSLMLLEWLCIVLPGLGIWFLWHLASSSPRVRFQRFTNSKDVKKHNWFLNRDSDLCWFYFVKNGVKHIIVIEPSDEMVDMMKPYLNFGVWND